VAASGHGWADMPDPAAAQGLRCPQHGVLAEGVPFARPDSRHTRDFEDLVAWLVTKTDKTTVSGFARIAWRTVGAIC
jgi:transposase